jgi:hypothetical protein
LVFRPDAMLESEVSGSQVSQAEPRKGLKTGALILALIVLVLAVSVLAWRNRQEGQPSGPESAVPYVCLECQHVFKLTPADFERLSKEHAVKGPADPTAGGILLFKCPSCGKLAGAQAVACPKDGKMLPRRLANGKPGRCPQCGWSFYTR